MWVPPVLAVHERSISKVVLGLGRTIATSPLQFYCCQLIAPLSSLTAVSWHTPSDNRSTLYPRHQRDLCCWSCRGFVLIVLDNTTLQDMSKILWPAPE